VRRLSTVIRALETFSFGLFLLGWLLLGTCGTWTDTTPFWLGAPLLWLAALCGLFGMHRGLKGELSRGCTVLVMLFTAYILWRALESDVAYLARADAVFCSTAFIAWVLTAARFEKPRHRFALLWVWALLILGNLGLGIWQVGWGDGPYSKGDPHANPLSFLGVRRDLSDAVFGGFFPNSNHLCGFLELTALPMLAVAVFGRVHSFVRVLCGLVFIAGAVAVAMSTSRGGLAFGAGVLIFAALSGILHLKRGGGMKGRTGSTAAIFIALAVVCSGVGWLTWNKLESAFGKGSVFNNLNGRTELWSRAAEQWLESPVIGTGARSYEYYEPKYRDLKTKWITWNETDVNARWAHNDWIQILSDYGLIGLLLAAAVLAFHCWKALSFMIHDASRAKREGGGFFTDHRGAITLGALCGMIAFAIHCMADFHMHVGVNAVLAAAVLGLMANPGRAAEAEFVRETTPRIGWRMATTLTAAVPAAVLGFKVLPWAVGDYNFFRASSIYTGAVDRLDDLLLASATFQIATDADPENYNAWQHRGFAEAGSAQLSADSPVFQQQCYAKAFQRFETAHRLYPQNADISANAARMLDAQGKYSEAEVWHARALKWSSGSRLIHWWYADHLRALGQYQAALDHYWPVLHKHKVGGVKRTAIQRSIEYCQRKLRAAGLPVAPPPPP
jgi:O-antigen ligase